MRRFADIPVRRKLTLLILLTCTAALLLAGAALVVSELFTFRRTMSADLAILADVLGQNGAAAVQFNDDKAAETTLASLRADPQVVAAALYARDGSRLATYARDGAKPQFPERPGEDGRRFDAGRLTLFGTVQSDQKRVGTIYLEADMGKIYDRLGMYSLILLAVIVGVFLISAFAAGRVHRPITRPILALAETARQVADQKDYSVRAEKQGQDEIGSLTDAFNQMVGDFREQTQQITDSITMLTTAAGAILTSATQVATGASETATAVTQTTTTVEEVRQTAQMTSQKSRYVAESAQKAVQISGGGKKSTEEASEGMVRIREQMASIAQSMVRLSEQTQAIGQIIATVDDLAQQSNLLAVNASIEAAKAGEQGKGFAVVAQEVKSLAEQSKAATTQVRTILSDIQKATGAAVMATEQGTKAVEAGVRQSSAAGESIVSLTSSVHEAAQAAQQIAASSQQQLVGMDQVAQAMESIKQAAIGNVDGAKHLETAAKSLDALGQRLKDRIARYKLQAQASGSHEAATATMPRAADAVAHARPA